MSNHCPLCGEGYGWSMETEQARMNRLLAIEAAAKEIAAMWDQGFYLPSDFTQPKMDALRAALGPNPDN